MRKNKVALAMTLSILRINHIITQPSIYGVIVYFLLCHESLYHGLVTPFPIKTHRRLSTCATTMRVRLVYKRRSYATMVKIRHGLAPLNPNNSIVYGQKHFETKIEVW